MVKVQKRCSHFKRQLDYHVNTIMHFSTTVFCLQKKYLGAVILWNIDVHWNSYSLPCFCYWYHYSTTVIVEYYHGTDAALFCILKMWVSFIILLKFNRITAGLSAEPWASIGRDRRLILKYVAAQSYYSSPWRPSGPFTTRAAGRPTGRTGAHGELDRPIRFFPPCVFYPPSQLFSPPRRSRANLARPPASDTRSAGIAQRLWRHSNTVNSFSRPALNSTITAAAQADVPAETEHSVSDKMQGSPVTTGIRGNAVLLNRLFYTTLT